MSDLGVEKISDNTPLSTSSESAVTLIPVTIGP
jgi:hypothetical protein